MSIRPRVLLAVLAVALATAAIILPLVLHDGPPGTVGDGASLPAVGGGAPKAGTPICGQPILNSPWHYDGPAGTYTTSGSPASLPTFGSPGSDFPAAKRIIVVAAGDNTSAANGGAYEVNNTVVYFEPGTHTIQNGMYAGHDSAYVGGYTASTGKAIIDGRNGGTKSGLGGAYLSLSKPSANHTVRDTWEYLTIKNYAAAQNGQVMGNTSGGGVDDGDVYKYNTIGPNDYGYGGESRPPRTGKSSGGGYAIALGSYNTVQYNCLIHNAQGGFNDGGVGDVIANNEISWNGLGEYPDSGGSGASPFSCGCSGGGKLLLSVNADIVKNWVHDNYNAGIWLDFNNTGATIAYNYVSSNWGTGIVYEASYNANIFSNTLVGNGWASHGAWPAGVHGGDCGDGVSCTVGAGPRGGRGGFPYATIYLPNSGGNANLTTISIPNTIAVPGCRSSCGVRSRYSGQLVVRNNVLVDNFGGVMVYTDTNRYPGDIDQDGTCDTPLGALSQANSKTYYEQSKVLITNADTIVSASSVTSTGGTKTICANYGNNGGPNVATSAPHAPSVGMAVYDQESGSYLGNVTSVTSANAFSISGSHRNMSQASLLLSAYGGCGPADYFGAGPGVVSGRPSANYWDNCIWGSRNVTVAGNTFSMDASRVTGCTRASMCGYQAAMAFQPGVPALMQFFKTGFFRGIAAASGPGSLGNVWSDNTYIWTGGGPGRWQFAAGPQLTTVTRDKWRASPYDQDRGSRFSD